MTVPYTAVTRDSRHPFETYILGAAVVGGGFALFGNLWPASIEKAFSPWAQTVWGLFFGGGALIALVGIVLKKRDIGIFMEQIGLVAFGGACVTYATALLVYNFSGSFVVSVLFLLLAAASARQWWRLEQAVRGAIRHGQAMKRVRFDG